MIAFDGWLSAVLAALVSAVAPPPPASFPACAPHEKRPRLTSFAQLGAGAAFVVDVERSASGDFIPRAPVSMPPHHSSRIEWANLAAWPALATARADDLRFGATLLGSDVQKVPSRQGARSDRWWATYRARIDDVCRASVTAPAATRPPTGPPG